MAKTSSSTNAPKTPGLGQGPSACTNHGPNPPGPTRTLIRRRSAPCISSLQAHPGPAKEQSGDQARQPPEKHHPRVTEAPFWSEPQLHSFMAQASLFVLFWCPSDGFLAATHPAHSLWVCVVNVERCIWRSSEWEKTRRSVVRKCGSM